MEIDILKLIKFLKIIVMVSIIVDIAFYMYNPNSNHIGDRVLLNMIILVVLIMIDTIISN